MHRFKMLDAKTVGTMQRQVPQVVIKQLGEASSIPFRGMKIEDKIMV